MNLGGVNKNVRILNLTSMFDVIQDRAQQLQKNTKLVQVKTTNGSTITIRQGGSGKSLFSRIQSMLLIDKDNQRKKEEQHMINKIEENIIDKV